MGWAVCLAHILSSPHIWIPSNRPLSPSLPWPLQPFPSPLTPSSSFTLRKAGLGRGGAGRPGCWDEENCFPSLSQLYLVLSPSWSENIVISPNPQTERRSRLRGRGGRRHGGLQAGRKDLGGKLRCRDGRPYKGEARRWGGEAVSRVSPPHPPRAAHPRTARLTPEQAV